MTISIFGLAGYNTGDIAIAESLNLLLRSNNTLDKEFILRIGTVKKNALKTVGIHEFDIRRNSIKGLLSIIRVIKNSDVILIGGGSLIQDKLGGGLFRGVLGYTFTITLLCVLCKKKYTYITIGIDKLQKKFNEYIALFCLKNAKEVVVRDEFSKTLCKKYSGREARLIYDPAYILNQDLSNQQEKNGEVLVKYNLSISKKYIVISLVKEVFGSYDSLRKAKELVSYFCKEKQIDKVVLLAMDSRTDDEVGIFREIERTLQSKKISIIKETTPLETVIILQNSSFNILTRLHSMILGIRVVPFFILSRTTKTEALVSILDVPKEFVGGIEDYSPKKIISTYKQSIVSREKFNYSNEIDKITTSIYKGFATANSLHVTN